MRKTFALVWLVMMPAVSLLNGCAAVVVGGTSLMGGRGSVAKSFLGVLIIATLEAGLVQVGASEPMKRVVTGAVIVAAVLADTWRRK